MLRTTTIFLVAGLAAAGVASAQAPAPAPAQPAPPPAEAPATPGALPELLPENYIYQPEGRRDPFLNLLGTGNTPQAGGQRNEGAAGLRVAEITVRGVLASGGALIAMIQAPDNKTYIVRQGDKLNDGTIRSITPTGLVIVQEVNDPLSLVKQREIHKLLRSQEGVKE
jgi:Tfp pilus assembly protein PilP